MVSAFGYLPSRWESTLIDRYQIVLLNDRGTTVWTVCPESVRSRAQTSSRNRDASGNYPSKV